MAETRDRAELKEDFKWDLESIYESGEKWEEDFNEVEELLEEIDRYQGGVLKSADNLLEVLRLREKIFRKVDKLFAYARMKSDENTRDQTYQALSSRARGLHSSAESAASFIEPEIQSSTEGEIEELIDDAPELEKYRHYLEDVLRLKPHTRNPEVESLLADLEEVLAAPGEIYNYLTNADLEFPEVEDPEGGKVKITLSNFVTLLKRDEREFRGKVYEKFFSKLKELSNTVSISYENSVKTDNKLAKIRNYDSAREKSLDQNNIPVEIYDNLIKVVENNLDLLHKHLQLKKEAMGWEEFRMWDVYTSMAGTEIPELSYEEARSHVLEAIKPLGDDYKAQVEQGFQSRWIDVYETPGKRAGAYSGGAYDTQPFILMNFEEDISSLYTLAHELGHSMHSKLTSENQPYIYGDYSIFIAEVASTMHEALLTEHMLEEVEDPEFRLHILDHFLESFRTVLFRQTMFAHFEHEVHEKVSAGEGLTLDKLNDLFRSLKEDYYEPAIVDDSIESEWMRIPHFYRAYYVYQYSTGISASLALSQKVMEEGRSAVERYRNLLKTGSSKYPLDALKDAGVDMSQPKPVKRALSMYDKYLDRMEELI